MPAEASLRFQQDVHVIRNIHSLSTFFALFSLVATVFQFWIRGNPAFPPLHFITFLGLLCASFSALACREDWAGRARLRRFKRLARVLALFVVFLGLVGPSFDITPFISVTLIFLGFALFIYNQHRISIVAGQVLAVTTGAIAVFIVNRYLFTLSEPRLVPADFSYMGMRPLTALIFSTLSLSVLCSRPADEWMSFFTRNTKSAAMARNILITAVFAPPFIGVLARLGVEFGWYDLSVQFALYALVMTGLILRITWISSKSVEAEELQEARRENQLRLVIKTSIDLARVFKEETPEQQIAKTLTPHVADAAALGIGPTPHEPIGLSHSNPRFERPFRQLAQRILRGDIKLDESQIDLPDQPIVIEDFSEIRPRLVEELKGPPELIAYLNEIQSVAFWPLRVWDRYIGSIVVVTDSSKRRLLRSDREFFAAFSTRFGFFIENAQLLRELQEAVKIREDVLSVVSHDLKNPVASIQIAAQLLGALNPVEKDKLQELTGKIQRAADQIQHLITGLLDFAKIRSGTFSIEAYEENLPDIIHSVVDVVKLQAETKKQKLTLDIPPSLPNVACDARRIAQVVMNVLGNAIKFTPEGGTIAIKAYAEGPFVRIAISDNGPGIAPDDLNRIFERFWQARPARHLGSGLGLAIASGIVKAHGGKIWAESELTKGSTFHFTIPVAGADTPKKQRAETYNEIDKSWIAKSALFGAHVLLVDDSTDMLSLLKRLLESVGVKVSTASNVPEAYELFLHEHPHVVVTDIEMPGETGIDLIRKIRRLPPDSGGQTPVAAITAYSRDEELRRIDEAGFDLKIIKPVDANSLISTLNKLASISRSHGRSTRLTESAESP